ncbi:T9SS type A sorting domain-containing protein [Terrimonas sp. NA20]|uniref:T9SS type A sorting domain-containing protein n=1 Tax=Terrimonas ginsenosidimutans TaxID=2908004 RepID=A0ABS9KXA0_9BACT|nr:T9SS type A sorting domain-containing protein [Terrimonas ginsenosidimutans]MCG2616971.1 T9SS type A sorting domain-containing protein [Terrimonas ginsenosidimutans]
MTAINQQTKIGLLRLLISIFFLTFLFTSICAQTGITWTARSYPAENAWLSVAYGNGRFVATASSGTGNRVMTSVDGINWVTQTTPADNVWAAVAFGGNLFVAVGTASASPNTVMTSPDGITWTLRSSADNGSQWTALTYGNGRFVALAQLGTLRSMTSTDGINWTAGTGVPAATWGAVTYGNGTYVGVSQSSTEPVVTSTDGINWTVRAIAGTTGWWGVDFGNNLFVAVRAAGTGQRVMTSPDGITWTLRNTPVDNNWRVVKYGGGLFVALSLNGTGNRIMTSPDGIAWTSRASTADNPWRGLGYGNGMWVATSINPSANGTRVMTSGTMGPLPVRWLSFSGRVLEGTNRLDWETATESDNLHFEIERSSDGQAFVKIGIVPASPGGANGAAYGFTDQQPLAGTSFYRLKQVDINGQFAYSKTIMLHAALNTTLTVYPNPTNDWITVKGLAGDAPPVYQILNVMGLQVKSGIIPTNNSLDVRSLPKGQYLLKVNDRSAQFLKL